MVQQTTVAAHAPAMCHIPGAGSERARIAPPTREHAAGARRRQAAGGAARRAGRPRRAGGGRPRRRGGASSRQAARAARRRPAPRERRARPSTPKKAAAAAHSPWYATTPPRRSSACEKSANVAGLGVWIVVATVAPHRVASARSRATSACARRGEPRRRFVEQQHRWPPTSASPIEPRPRPPRTTRVSARSRSPRASSTSFTRAHAMPLYAARPCRPPARCRCVAPAAFSSGAVIPVAVIAKIGAHVSHVGDLGGRERKRLTCRHSLEKHVLLRDERDRRAAARRVVHR